MNNANITTQEQADAMQAAYRSKCDWRRNGHLIQEREGNKWVTRFDGSANVQNGIGVNAAKRKVRRMVKSGTKVYKEL